MRQVASFRALVLSLLLSACAFAQRDLGTITGTVTDAEGAAVPNAKVTIVEDATNLSYVVTTTEGGEYSRTALKPGTYTIQCRGAWIPPRCAEECHHYRR